MAVDDAATTAEETAVSGNVLANDTDVDAGTTLTATLVANAGERDGDAGVERRLHLHAGRELQRHRQLHLHGERRHGGLEHRDGDDHGHGRSTTRRWRSTTRRRPRKTRAVSGNVLANDTDVDAGTTLTATLVASAGERHA